MSYLPTTTNIVKAEGKRGSPITKIAEAHPVLDKYNQKKIIVIGYMPSMSILYLARRPGRPDKENLAFDIRLFSMSML